MQNSRQRETRESGLRRRRCHLTVRLQHRLWRRGAISEEMNQPVLVFTTPPLTSGALELSHSGRGGGWDGEGCVEVHGDRPLLPPAGMSTNTRQGECCSGVCTVMNVPGVSVRVLSERSVSRASLVTCGRPAPPSTYITKAKENRTCCSFAMTDVENSAT